MNTTNEDLQARSAELQGLARAREEERRSAEASRRRLEAILGGMSGAVLAVDGEGKELFTSEIFRETFGDGEPQEPEGGPRLGGLVPLDEGGAALPPEATPQVQAARGEAFEMRFAVEGEDGTRRVFEARGRPIDGETSGGGVIVIRQISEGWVGGQRALNTWDRRDLEIEHLKGENERLRERERAVRAEAEDTKRRLSELTAASKRFASSMRGGVRERQQYRRRLAAQLAVSRVLSEARDLDEAAPKVFEILGKRLGWEVGVLWLPSGNVLRCAGEWRCPGAPPGTFEEACERSSFRRGVGLPGRVWERAEPVWVEDVVEDADFSRKEAAAEDNLHGAFAFPIRDGGLVGVFEHFRREALPPDDDLLRTAALIGDQIGQFVERRRAEEAVRWSQERTVFRATLADLLRPLTDPAEIMAEANRALGRRLEASRVTYGEGSPDGEVVSVTGRAHLDDYASALMGHFRAGRTVVVADVLDDPALTVEQRAAFEAVQIRAHVSVPLVKGGLLVGALGVTQATARAWTADEVALVEETAEQTWAAVERARTEEALRESVPRFRTLFNSIDEGFCVVEMIFDENDRPIDYRFLEVSPSFEKQTGLVNAQGKRMRELAPQHEEHWFEVYGEIALTGKPARFESRAEQLHRWYDVYAFRFGEPANRQVAILFNDVTERKRTEARLRDSEERYRSLVTATSSIVWTVAPTGECVEEMPSWEDFTGQSFEQYRGFGWLDAVHPDDRPPTGVWDNLDPDDAPLEVEYRLRRHDGEYRRVVSRSVPVFDADGGVREWVGTMLDVEMLRRSEIEGGLARSLSGLLETTAPPDVRYEVSVEGDEAAVPPHVANQVFLILREAIRNAVAHSDCKRVAVGIEVAPSGLTGFVEDDGSGLKAGGGKSNGGVGLRSMKERAALLGGAVRVSSRPDAGTKVEVSVPLTEEDVR